MADEEKETGPSDAQLMSEVTARRAEVTAFLNKREKGKALAASLVNPPIAAKGADVKVHPSKTLIFYCKSNLLNKYQDANAATLEKVLASMTEAEINTAIESMDITTCEIFLKYVYKYMGKSTNCGLMLKLHSTLTDKTGTGGIVRVLTDRKQV